MRRVRKNQNTPKTMAMKTTGITTPIAALAPVDSPPNGLEVGDAVLAPVDVDVDVD